MATVSFEDVDKLKKVAPTLPSKVKEVSDEAAAYQQAVQGYLAKLKQKATTAKDLQDKVEQALSALDGKAADEQPVLEGGMKEVESALEQAVKDLDEGKDELETGVEQAGDAMKNLREKLGEAGDRAQAAQGTIVEKFEDLKEGLESGRSELSSAGETAAKAGDGVEEEVANQGQKFHEASEALAAKMKTILGWVEDRVGDAGTRLTKLLADHQGEVQEALEDMVKKSGEIYEQLQEGLNEEKEKLTKIAQDLEEAMVDIGGLLGEARQACAEDHGEAQESLDLLDAEMPPLEIAWKSVKSAADKISPDTWPG